MRKQLTTKLQIFKFQLKSFSPITGSFQYNQGFKVIIAFSRKYQKRTENQFVKE